MASADRRVHAQVIMNLCKQELGQDAASQAAYEKALALEPDNPETLNNLAWLLITSRDPAVPDPERALFFSKQAASLQPTAGYILDTLAAAYWANNMLVQALETEDKAIDHDPANHMFYRRQMEFFLKNRWPADLQSWSKQK